MSNPVVLLNPVSFYKCLADEIRLRCMILIEQEKELCVCELTQALDEIQPKVSRHLAQLRQCALLTDRRQGQWVFYQINPALPNWAKAVLSQTAQANQDFIKQSLINLARMGSRPDRTKICG